MKKNNIYPIKNIYTKTYPAMLRGVGGKRQQTSGVVRSCEVMPNLPAPGGRLAKQSSQESVSSEGSKWVQMKLTNESLNWMVFPILKLSINTLYVPYVTKVWLHKCHRSI